MITLWGINVNIFNWINMTIYNVGSSLFFLFLNIFPSRECINNLFLFQLKSAGCTITSHTVQPQQIVHTGRPSNYFVYSELHFYCLLSYDINFYPAFFLPLLSSWRELEDCREWLNIFSTIWYVFNGHWHLFCLK